MTHNITKFIRNFGSDYFCEECNTSYPSKKALAEDHDIEKVLITIQVKRGKST